jgi:hypothetical protein
VLVMLFLKVTHQIHTNLHWSTSLDSNRLLTKEA